MLSSRNLCLQAADNVEGYKGAEGMDIVAVEDVDDCCFGRSAEDRARTHVRVEHEY
jgi:hypothetical protein